MKLIEKRLRDFLSEGVDAGQAAPAAQLVEYYQKAKLTDLESTDGKGKQGAKARGVQVSYGVWMAIAAAYQNLNHLAQPVAFRDITKLISRQRKLSEYFRAPTTRMIRPKVSRAEYAKRVGLITGNTPWPKAQFCDVLNFEFSPAAYANATSKDPYDTKAVAVVINNALRKMKVQLGAAYEQMAESVPAKAKEQDTYDDKATDFLYIGALVDQDSLPASAGKDEWITIQVWFYFSPSSSSQPEIEKTAEAYLAHMLQRAVGVKLQGQLDDLPKHLKEFKTKYAKIAQAAEKDQPLTEADLKIGGLSLDEYASVNITNPIRALQAAMATVAQDKVASMLLKRI